MKIKVGNEYRFLGGICSCCGEKLEPVTILVEAVHRDQYGFYVDVVCVLDSGYSFTAKYSDETLKQRMLDRRLVLVRVAA